MISVGIDVSKGKSTVCILKPGGEVVKPPFELDHAADRRTTCRQGAHRRVCTGKQR